MFHFSVSYSLLVSQGHSLTPFPVHSKITEAPDPSPASPLTSSGVMGGEIQIPFIPLQKNSRDLRAIQLKSSARPLALKYLSVTRAKAANNPLIPLVGPGPIIQECPLWP